MGMVNAETNQMLPLDSVHQNFCAGKAVLKATVLAVGPQVVKARVSLFFIIITKYVKVT